ncbi:ROK family protein [Microbacterium aurantiacum]|uniref:ROK family protein n=1 Tax=Microbacterium aurantiacum TaxID=162393 RepID=UPI004035333C
MTTITIDFGGTDIKVGLFRDAAHSATPYRAPVFDATISVPAQRTRGDLAATVEAVRSLQVELGDAGGVIDAVGITVPGIVDRDGRMLHAHEKYDDFRALDLSAWSRQVFGVERAVIENDARAALVGSLGTATSLSDPRPQNAVVITLGTGVGTAAMLDGVLFRGAHAHAGILGGHVTVDVTGERCPCGNRGCAELLASSTALRDRRDVSAHTLAELFAAGTAADDAVADEFIRVWGAVAVTLCHMYDPEVVLLTGGVLRAGERVRQPLEHYLHAHLWPTAFRPPVVVPPDPHLSVLYGLAILAGHRHVPADAMSTEKTGAQ